MDFLERDLEDIIYGTDPKFIRSRGLYEYRYDLIQRQLHLLDYGKADLVTVQFGVGDGIDMARTVHVTVYELKQSQVGVNALLQASRYYAGIRQIIEYLEEYYNFTRALFTYSIVLIGRTVDLSGDFCFLTDMMSERLRVYTYSYAADGIKFHREQGYSLTGCDMESKAEDLLKLGWKDAIRKNILSGTEF